MRKEEEAAISRPLNTGHPVTAAGHWWQARWIVQVIGVTKLFKSLVLLLVGIGALRLLHGDIHEKLDTWVHVARVDPDNYFVHAALEKLFVIKGSTLLALGLGTFLYSALYLLEGVGLLFDKTWAEWLTVIISTGFIPMEIYHVVTHGFHPIGVSVFLFNVVAVLFLIGRLRGKHAEHIRPDRAIPGNSQDTVSD